MFQRLFGREQTPQPRIVDALYAAIVAAARQPASIRDWDVPDTLLGRFEMLSLHMSPVPAHAARRDRRCARDRRRSLIDEFFTDVEHSLRELGIGDIGVPKRMKKLAGMFYGRTGPMRRRSTPATPRRWRGAGAQYLARRRRDWPRCGSWPTM